MSPTDNQLQGYGSSLLKAAKTWEAWLAGGLPLSLMAMTLIWATARKGGPGAGHPHLFIGIQWFDFLLRWCGNLLCLPVLLSRLWAFGPKPEFLQEKHGSRISWVPSSWVFGPLVVWLVMWAFRLIGLLLVHPYNYNFSDHIFLLMSMVAMIQMELILASVAVASGGGQSCGGCTVMAVAWLLLLLIFWEAFNTARYFHSAAAAWGAFGAGSLFFLPPVIWWFQLVLHSREELRRRTDDGHRRLIEGA